MNGRLSVSKRGKCCRLVHRGEVRSPENSLLCVFGQANPAPTADDGIDRFGFDTLPRSTVAGTNNLPHKTA
ncbi:hypothetical protein [Phocaeicola massiliensis]|uniref:hypothetical protein n=1 Tax=Phocaeicola massiliensis TaxID=204516 RepID=UPI0015B48011